ncbi:MAG: flippase-like domain-containing protein [Acidobacteria bacterium]|nr:flippase-like domain-containing protein [Acidobacteriota bacterium]
MDRAIRLFGLLIGLALLAWLWSHTDVAALLGVFPRIGWGFVAILAARGATVVIDAAAWSCLMTSGERPRFRVVLPLRWIAESINTTLPAAQIGGDLVRARLLGRYIAAPAHGAATVAVDFCLSLFAQILFTLLGFVLLVWLSRNASWWPVAASAALVPAFAALSWELLVRRRLLALAEGWALRWHQQRLAGALASLGAALALVARGRAAIAASLGFHVASFLGHAGELWLTLWLMGVPAGVAEATMLESLSLAVRSAAFLIPSGWGAQEASLVALAALTGLSADAALALGLVKRAREFAVGLPGLAAWMVAERRPPRV